MRRVALAVAFIVVVLFNSAAFAQIGGADLVVPSGGSGGTGPAGPTGATGPAGPAPAGNAPQVVGYSAANTPEAETVSGAGDCATVSFARSGANAYTMTSTCLSSNGHLFTSTAFGAALNLSTLLSQDCTVSSSGVVTCTKAGNGTGSFQVGSLGVGVAADGTSGDTKTSGTFLCGTNNVSCITEADTGGTQRKLIALDNSNNLNIGPSTGSGINGTVINAGAAEQIQLTVGGIAALTIGASGTKNISGLNGWTFQSTGGTAPTVTCSGGSTGTSVTTGSTNNRGSIVSSSSSSTSCTITWSASGTWNQAPFCHFFDAGASITPVAYSTGACGTSTCVVDFASAASKTIGYMCM
jgi:hypothetical protein